MPERHILIQRARIFGVDAIHADGWLLAEDGRIRMMGSGAPPPMPDTPAVERLDAGGMRLVPGFIDLHAHGAVGHEVMDASPDGIRAMARFFASHGVTGFLATTWTATRADIDRVLACVAPLVGVETGGAAVLGVHLEGPYINSQRAGAQDAHLIRRADRQEALAWLDSGIVRLVAVAPEYEQNLWLVDECVRRGIAVSAGHTAATFEQMQAAVEHGVRQATHCFNAMSPFGHREPGAVGAALYFDQIRCELIADNIHVAPPAQRILVRAKGTDGVILITDSLRGAGLPDGEYNIGGRTIRIQGGAARLPDGTLAGSVLTMERALQNVMRSCDLPLEAALPMSALNAARAIGLEARKGSLEPGKDADLTLLDEDGQVRLTCVAGKIVYNAL
jgi:N-acetylglucosamine-6-phosphate deacetylase